MVACWPFWLSLSSAEAERCFSHTHTQCNTVLWNAWHEYIWIVTRTDMLITLYMKMRISKCNWMHFLFVQWNHLFFSRTVMTLNSRCGRMRRMTLSDMWIWWCIVWGEVEREIWIKIWLYDLILKRPLPLHMPFDYMQCYFEHAKSWLYCISLLHLNHAHNISF